MKRVWWLASYPKSGNTWFRAFLTALLRPDRTEHLLNYLIADSINASCKVFEEETGVDSDELLFEDIQALRSAVLRGFAQRAQEPLYIKIHDARIDPISGINLIPSDVTAGAIYLVRNPLDVAVSFAHHSGKTVQFVAEFLSRAHGVMSWKKTQGRQRLPEVLGTWSTHVTTWTDHDDFPVLVLRYEDLLSEPIIHFTRAAAFLDVPHTEQTIQRALEACAFALLQQAEQSKGFPEKPLQTRQFFRRGQTGSWREELPVEVAHRMIQDHKDMMQRLGYWNEDGPRF